MAAFDEAAPLIALLEPAESGWQIEADDESRAETRGGDAMVIYIWKRKGWRKYRVRES